jgi:TIR domain
MDSQEKTHVFISYPSERLHLAEDIAAALEAEGCYDVFFDRHRLEPGVAYDAIIRENVAHCQLFVMLITPEILKDGSYVLTELKFAKAAWPNSPIGHVVPVMIEEVDPKRLDPYLRRRNLLRIEGDATAEVAAAVHALLRGRASAVSTSILRPEMAAQQLQAYRALWSLTGVLPKWPRDPTVSYSHLIQLSRDLRDWYFGQAGGLFLTGGMYSRYADLQVALQAIPQSPEPLSAQDYDDIRHLCSLLRRQIAVDIGARPHNFATVTS